MAAESAAIQQANRVVRRLAKDFPDAQCALHHENAFQLLIATILAAQCTDERVNQVTKTLFKDFPTPADFAAASIPTLEKAVQSTGFFRNKAKNIKACCQQLVEEHDGEIPQDLDELVKLPGIGRKTANVVLGVAFNIPTGVVVDTHVGRVSRRLGLTSNKDAVKAERDLMKLVPREQWISFSHRMILHGRTVCKSRKPTCEACSMNDYCPRMDVPN